MAEIEAVLIPVSVGELIDKISILEIKYEKVTQPQKRENIVYELTLLKQKREALKLNASQLAPLEAELDEVNRILWDVEDALRLHEKEGTFNAKFIELARMVYHTNDKRSGIKKRINLLFGSVIVEEKSYV